MQNFSYSTVGIIAIIIQLIINGPIMFGKRGKVNKYYRAFSISLLMYYVTDMCWGLLAGLEWTVALFIDTTVYFVAMGSIVVWWYCYIVDYLEQNGRTAGFFKSFGMFFIAAEAVFLAVNHFTPVFFWFDDTGAYHTGIVRNIALWLQIVMCIVSGVTTIKGIRRSSGRKRQRNFVIFLFSAVMLAAILGQIVLPTFPVYAFGCLIGSCILYVYVIEDEREELRELLAEEKENAEHANRSKSTFLFNMSHDIRTPMNAILGYSNRMIKHIDDKDIVLDGALKIKTSGEYLLSLINNVLDMARIESDKVKLEEDIYDISGRAHTLCDIFEVDMQKKNLTFVVDFDDIQDHILWYDSLKLRQIILNLISNAVKYTPDGGTITHTMRQLKSDKEGRGRYEIVVKDTGIGMSQEYVKHIFEQFSRSEDAVTRTTQGTGLGMSIVGKLVDLMGGTIKINSTLGVGTEIIVTLDLKLATEEEIHIFNRRNAPVESARDLNGIKVLLVDDNELNREIAQEILEEEGVIVADVAENGVIALGKVRMSSPGDYDLILMDIQMPVMDGYEAARRIRALEDKRLADIPIIAMTANAFEEDRQNAFAAGMNEHVTKPVDVEKLKEAMRRLS